MEKEFVPIDLSLKLKELGFDEPCFGYYKDKKLSGVNKWDRKDWEFHILKNKDITNLTSEIILAPLYQQAFRWFRKKHNLIFQINYLFNGNYQVVIHRNTHEYMELIQNLKHACVYEIPDNYSYEEAELACLQELIGIVKSK